MRYWYLDDFQCSILIFHIFSYGIAVLGSPKCLPPYVKTFMCSPGRGSFCALDWNDLPVGREFDGKFWKNVNPHSMPSLTIPLPLTQALH